MARRLLPIALSLITIQWMAIMAAAFIILRRCLAIWSGNDWRRRGEVLNVDFKFLFASPAFGEVSAVYPKEREDDDLGCENGPPKQPGTRAVLHVLH